MFTTIVVIFVMGGLFSFYLSHKKKIDETASRIDDCIKRIDPKGKST